MQAARTKAELYRGLLAEGRNPWDKAERGRIERAADHIPTLAEAARKVHAQKVEGGEINTTPNIRPTGYRYLNAMLSPT